MTQGFVEVLGCVSLFPLEEGQRYELDPRKPFVINRGSGDFNLPHARVSRHHARLEFSKGSWWAVDSSSTNGTSVNGRHANPAIRLEPGDVIDIAGVLWLRFGVPAVRHDALEESICDEPLDEMNWRVWQDWLHEQNDPLATWMNARERTMTELAASMGPLARAFKGRELICAWNRMGFVSHLTMQFQTLGDLPNALWVLKHLEEVPAARFVTSLTLEMLPVALREPEAPAVTLVEALATSHLPRSLRQLHLDGRMPAAPVAGFRAMTEVPPVAKINQALDHVRRRARFLETTHHTLISWRPSASVVLPESLTR